MSERSGMPEPELSTEVLECRILVVDDEAANVRVLERLLNRAGFSEVRTLTDPRVTMRTFETFEPDLLLLDLHMPWIDGFGILEMLRERIPQEEDFPILVLTGDLSEEVQDEALSMGARDFLTKPFNTSEVLLRIQNLLETRVLHLRLQRHNRTLEERVQQRTRDLAEAQVEILHRLALAAEYRDDLTGRHAERVGLLSALIGRELGLPEDEVRLLRRAATLHDVGKIGVSDSILMKPGPLTDREFSTMQRHTDIGERILSGSRFPLLQMAAEVATSHHEWWNGGGYGKGLSGPEIPLTGRIVAVADVFDSLSHERPYKRAFTREETLGYVRAGAGKQFDPGVVEAFFRLVDQGLVDRLDSLLAEPPAELPSPSVFRTPGAVALSEPAPSSPEPSSAVPGSDPPR